MYGYTCLVVEHRFDVITEVKLHRSRQPTSDHYVSRAKLLTTPSQLRRQPCDARRGVTGCG